jgi:hypothetical protein
MSDPLAITDEEAEGLARLAQAQLRLATRLSERSLDEPDVDAACRLARASERVARGYRQSLLLKSRLKRDRDAARREAATHPVARTPLEQARVNKRIRDVCHAVERLVAERAESFDGEEIDDMLTFALDTLEEEARDDGFLAEPMEAQVARLCDTLGLPAPASARAGPDTS